MQFKKKALFVFLFIILFLQNKKGFCFIRDFVESVKVIKVNSIKQEVDNFNKVILSGNVEVWVDEKLHIWADKVEIDEEKQFLVAQKESTSSIIIETNESLILADKLFLNLKDKTGYADNIRIHVAQGFIKASRAERINDTNWKMEDIIYTPCDAPSPHWSISARQAMLHGNYLLRVSGVVFQCGKIPFFILPSMVIPIQKRSKSGFLLPKFSYDDDLGFGVREEFYWSIFPRCDSTIGVDWREEKGLAFIDEFRWARSPESFTLVDGHYALEKNAFVKKRDRILQETERRYWIEGKDFQNFENVLWFDKLNTLLRLDFGTDKIIGYQFFDTMKNLDDTFYNSGILRSCGRYDFYNLMFDSSKTARRQFVPFTAAQLKEIYKQLPDVKDADKNGIFSKKREIEDRVLVYKVPHFEWNSIYRKYKNLFLYRHDFFADYAFAEKSKTERFYIDAKVVKENQLVKFTKFDCFRFYYKGDLQSNLKFKDQILRFYVDPNIQIVGAVKQGIPISEKNVCQGRMFSNGAYRIFANYGAEWDFPEAYFTNDFQNILYYFQPVVKWSFVPKFEQDHWYYFDNWDKAYPTNQIEINLRNNWVINNMQIDFSVAQAYDFYDNQDIFPLYRCPNQKNLLPFKMDLCLGCDIFNFKIAHEYNVKNMQLLQSEIGGNFDLNKVNLSFATLYQHRKLQKERELYSDIPHVLLLGISIPVLKNVTLLYDGQFYSEKDSKILPFEGIKPLLHRIKFDYQGHCWGVALGYEEKRYKEFGNWKSEKAFTLFVRLESLGSFARKFKRPAIYNRDI